MDLTYDRLYQILSIMLTIIVIGLVLGKVKMFTPEELWPLWRFTMFCCYPAAAFHLIGSFKLNYETWKPFIVACAIVASQFILAGLYCLFFKKKERVRMFFKASLIVGHNEYFATSFHIIQIIGGDKYMNIPIFYVLIEHWIILPILKIINFKLYSQLKNSTFTDIMTAASEATYTDTTTHRSNADYEDDQYPEPETLYGTVIWSWITPTTIMTLVGFAWSLTNWKMPLIISTLDGDLYKCICGAGLFSAGVLIVNMKFNFRKIIKFTPFIVLKYTIFPLIAGYLCYGLETDSTTRQICVLAAIAPISLNALKFSVGNDFEDMENLKAAFQASYILWYPFALAWGAILISTNLLK